MHSSVGITGCAILTPLDVESGAPVRGQHVAGTWAELQNGRQIVQKRAFPDAWLTAALRAARGKPDENSDASDKTSQIAELVARLAIADANIPSAPDPQAPYPDMPLFFGTSKGPVLTLLHAYDQLRQVGARGWQGLSPNAAGQVAMGIGAVGSALAQALKLPGGTTSVAACASGMHALHRAVSAVERGECPRALVVAADASLHPLFEGSFARLGVLAPADETGAVRCEPFADQGRGFFLIEAGAALLLEKHPQPGAVIIENTWIGGDATNLVAVDPETRSLRTGLRHAMPETAADLAFVHAHATGTAHDRYERAAIRAVAGPTVPIFSHKRWLGHSLGAAGLLSVALSALCHRRGLLPGGEAFTGNHSITVAQGFGGHIGVVGLRGCHYTPGL